MRPRERLLATEVVERIEQMDEAEQQGGEEQARSELDTDELPWRAEDTVES